MLNTTFEAAELTGVGVEDALPALVEFTAALAIAMSGEEGMNAWSPDYSVALITGGTAICTFGLVPCRENSSRLGALAVTRPCRAT